MNDDLQKQLAQLLASLSATAKDAANWTAGQLPPLIHEKIVFGRVEGTAWMVIFVVAIPVFGRIALKMGRAAEWEEGPNFQNLCSIACGALAILNLISALIAIHDFAMVWFAPRLYIVEWLRSMAK